MRHRIHALRALAALAAAWPTVAAAWPFTSTNPAQPADWVGSAGFNYTIRMKGSVWTVDTNADGQPDGWFTAGAPGADSWEHAPAGGLDRWRTVSGFNINAVGGDPLPAEAPDVADADPSWAAAFGAPGATWSADLAHGAGKDVLAAIYATPGVFSAATLDAGAAGTTDWALAQWPHVPGAGTTRIAVPLQGGSAANAITAQVQADRLVLQGWLTDADQKWAIDTNLGAAGNEISYNLVQATVYLRGTFAQTDVTLSIPAPLGVGTWELRKWTGAPVLHNGPVRTICASGCTHTTVHSAINAPNGTLVLIPPGLHLPATATGWGNGNAFSVSSKSHLTILGGGLTADETVLDGYPRDTALNLSSSNHIIVSNLTVQRGMRRSAMAFTSNRIEFSDVRVRGHGKLVASKSIPAHAPFTIPAAGAVTYNGPYGLTAFESTHVHAIRLDSRDNATGGMDIVRSQGVVLTDTNLQSNGHTESWACLYFATYSASSGVKQPARAHFRGANSIHDCFIGVHMEDQQNQAVELTFAAGATLSISDADAVLRRHGGGTTVPTATDFARDYGACWSLQDITFEPGVQSELHFQDRATAAAASANLALASVPHAGPKFDSMCKSLGYVANYTLVFEGSLWTVDSDNDGQNDDGLFVLGDRAGAAAQWGPGLSQRAFDLYTGGADAKPESNPDVLEGDSAWGTEIAQDGSAYGLELAQGDGKTALQAVHTSLTSAAALPLDTVTVPNPAEWAVAQWPYVGASVSRRAIPLSGSATSLSAVVTEQGALDRLDVVGALTEGDGGWNVDEVTAIAGDEDTVPLGSPNLYLRGTFTEAGRVVEIPNPIDPMLPPWRLREWRGEAVVHQGPVLEVCPASNTTWPRLGASCSHTALGTATAAAANGALIALSPDTFTTTAAGNQLALVSGKNRISILGAGPGCAQTVLATPAGKGYGIYVTGSSNVTIRNLTAKDAALHHIGVTSSQNVELSTVCGYGKGPLASNGQPYPGPTGLNFNLVQGGVMADVVSADNASNGIGVLGSTDVVLRNITVQNSGGSPGWAGLAIYTSGGPNVSGGNSRVRLEGTNLLTGVPMGIFLEDGVGRTLEFNNAGTTTIANYSYVPLFRGGFGTVSPSPDLIASSLGLCWRLDEIQAAGSPAPVSQAWYGSRPEGLAAEQGAAVLGFGSPVLEYNEECDCNGTEVCEDGNPCVAQLCGEGDGVCSYEARPLGECSGSPSAITVTDALCIILVSLATQANSPMPACLAVPLDDVDCNCDDTVTVEDILIVISRAVNLPLGAAIDDNSNQCPDNCEQYYP